MCNVYTRFQTKTAQKPYLLRRHTGADPGFFLGGGALVSCSSTSINHIVCFFAEYQLYYKTAGRLRGWGVRTPLHPPPRSAPGTYLYGSYRVVPLAFSEGWAKALKGMTGQSTGLPGGRSRVLRHRVFKVHHRVQRSFV